jgi:hypothetical protein
MISSGPAEPNLRKRERNPDLVIGEPSFALRRWITDIREVV